MFGNDGLPLGLSCFKELNNAQQSANLVFEHFEDALDRSYSLSLGAFGLFEVYDTLLDVIMKFSKVDLALLLNVGNAGEVLAGDTSCMEGTHGKLRSRFTNRLRSDDAG